MNELRAGHFSFPLPTFLVENIAASKMVVLPLVH